MNHERDVEYVLGHNEAELQRLIRQSAFFAELTEDVLRSAGVSEGMRVLDVGCGAGDVSLLAARLVGPSGAVLGVDRSPEALVLARRRADADRIRHVTFVEGDLAELELSESFDALIGRFVLMYFADPSGALEKMARNVRAGGIIAFQEMDMSAARSAPALPLYEKCGDWIRATFERANVDTKMGPGLYATFRRAGLPGPQLNLAARIGGGPETPLPAYIADVVVSLLPMMEKFGVTTAAEAQVETLAARLRDEVNSCNGVMISPSLVGAWTRKPV
jgi:SAM-dependent methyltransferase